ncbi:hypothetical protein [Streptomyces sp. NBC_01789]|uniref:hypothetical protein n=1 Tax=Streptomyces sp. NBC_01789 TaxID=2975941 RepID=UPI00225898CE|nr:hypothetical protein [Streptomyces sp. NBC_01789]MCX4450672.1 hypothetical protein [Streptomyces sp. NBC_01789]
MPLYSVTWPARPGGEYTQFIRAVDPADAVEGARELDWPTNDGYQVAFDQEPEVWQLRRPYRLRSRRVQGSGLTTTDIV